MYGHRKRVRTESGPWEKNPLPHRGLEPACRYDVLPTELHPRPITMKRRKMTDHVRVGKTDPTSGVEPKCQIVDSSEVLGLKKGLTGL